jgi:hypothetical protein
MADLGVVTTRAELLGKSTSYAAMVEHGLPVFLIDPQALPESEDRRNFALPGPDFPKNLATASREKAKTDRWAQLASAYEKVLLSSS